MARVLIGSDHAGYDLRDAVAEMLEARGDRVIIIAETREPAVDYPDVAHKLAARLTAGESQFGVLICGTGVGMSIVANRHCGVRAALCATELQARLAREHNHANVLCLAARLLGTEQALAITAAFFSAQPSDAERHCRRVRKMDSPAT